MNKLPTLFTRRRDETGRVVEVLPIPTAGCQWVLDGKGVATEMVDGECCAVIKGVLYRRVEVKRRKNGRLRAGAIPCQPDPDPYTGKQPFWVPVNRNRPEDKYYVSAWLNTTWIDQDGTYEAVGPNFKGNPYGLDDNFLETHGRIKINDCPRTYSGIKDYLRTHDIEGIVFWRDGKPMCKIKRKDFGFDWPVNGKGEEEN